MVQVVGMVPPRPGFSLMSLNKARGERIRKMKKGKQIIYKILKEGEKEVKKGRSTRS